MIRSGPPNGPPKGPPAHAPRSRQQDPTGHPFARRDPRDRSLRGGVGGDDLAEGGEEFDRTPAFAERLRAALRETDGDFEADDAPPSQADLQVLAVLSAVRLGDATGLSCAAADQPDTGPETPGAATLVAQLAGRLEAALRADLAAGAGMPLRLEISLDGLARGLQGVSVEMTGTELTVIVTRSPDLDGAVLAAASQDLAQRLQRRFGHRTVRVLERAADRGGMAEHPLVAIGRLLG